MCLSAKSHVSTSKYEEVAEGGRKTEHTFRSNDTLRCEVSAWNTQNVNNRRKKSSDEKFPSHLEEKRDRGSALTTPQQWRNFIVNYYSRKKSFYCDVDANAFSSPVLCLVITFHIRKLPSQRHKKSKREQITRNITCIHPIFYQTSPHFSSLQVKFQKIHQHERNLLFLYLLFSFFSLL